MKRELFTQSELSQLERTHKDGITSQELVKLLAGRGVKFSEATLRKYVQMGLLPRSRRVGRKGQRRGSIGLYPPSIIAQISAIKSGLKGNMTLDAMRSRSGIIADLEVLAAAFSRIRATMKGASKSDRHLRDLEDEWKIFDNEFSKLHERLQALVQSRFFEGAVTDGKNVPTREET